jgi:hypothetical protein
MVLLDIFICYLGYKSIMKSFDDYFMKKEYARVEELGDKLALIDPLIDWEVFRLIIMEMYDNRMNYVVGLIMMK